MLVSTDKKWDYALGMIKVDGLVYILKNIMMHITKCYKIKTADGFSYYKFRKPYTRI